MSEEFTRRDDALTPRVSRLVDALFTPADAFHAKRLLAQISTSAGERVQVAVLRLSNGAMAQLEQALQLALTDDRDALVAARFHLDTAAHETWADEVLNADGERHPWKRAEEAPVDWADSWILLAMYSCRGSGGDLASILFMADAINHAVPTKQELDHAFSRFANAGWLEHEGESWRLTRAGRRYVKATQGHRFSLRADFLERIRNLSMSLPPAGPPRDDVMATDEAVQAACDVNHAKMQRFIDRGR